MNINQAYSLFGLDSDTNTTLEELKKKYKSLAKNAHPDTDSGEHTNFVKLNQAYTTIKDSLINETSEQIKTSIDTSIATTDPVTKKQLKVHRALIDHQQKLISKTETVVKELINEYEDQKVKIDEELKKLLIKLEAKNKPSFIKMVLGGNNKDFLSRKEKLNKKHQDIKKELDIDFYQKAVSLYGESLNAISESIDRVTTSNEE